MTRRTELLDDLKAIRDHGRTPRIDTIHNRITAAVKVVAMAEEEIDDLHILAYERHTARRELAVAGGQPDYALDTNGDMRARDAYRQLGLATLDALEILEQAATDTIRVLRDGQRSQRRSRRMINLEELAAAIEARARRAARDEDYTPVRREPQPDADNVMTQLRKDRDKARAEANGLHKLVERLMKRIERMEHRASA